jgi:hypothetical protein
VQPLNRGDYGFDGWCHLPCEVLESYRVYDGKWHSSKKLKNILYHPGWWRVVDFLQIPYEKKNIEKLEIIHHPLTPSK